MQVHGVDDPIVPLRGGVGQGRGGVNYPPVEDTLSFWREQNRCEDEPYTRPQGAQEDCREWVCEEPTQACLVEDWKHAWPGGVNEPKSGFDVTTYAWRWWSTVLTPAPVSETP